MFFSILFALSSIVLLLSGYQVYGVMRFLPDNASLNLVQMTVLFCICGLFEGLSRTPRHNQLLPVGRKQQFWINFFLFLSKPVLTVLWLSIIIAVSWSQQHIMPDITLMGNYFTYHPVGTQLITLALVIIPTFSIYVGFAKSIGAIFTLSICSGAVGGAMAALIKVHVINLQITLTILAFITNTIFITLLIWHWFRRDHV